MRLLSIFFIFLLIANGAWCAETALRGSCPHLFSNFLTTEELSEIEYEPTLGPAFIHGMEDTFRWVLKNPDKELSWDAQQWIDMTPPFYQQAVQDAIISLRKQGQSEANIQKAAMPRFRKRIVLPAAVIALLAALRELMLRDENEDTKADELKKYYGVSFSSFDDPGAKSLVLRMLDGDPLGPRDLSKVFPGMDATFPEKIIRPDSLIVMMLFNKVPDILTYGAGWDKTRRVADFVNKTGLVPSLRLAHPLTRPWKIDDFDLIEKLLERMPTEFKIDLGASRGILRSKDPSEHTPDLKELEYHNAVYGEQSPSSSVEWDARRDQFNWRGESVDLRYSSYFGGSKELFENLQPRILPSSKDISNTSQVLSTNFARALAERKIVQKKLHENSKWLTLAFEKNPVSSWKIKSQAWNPWNVDFSPREYISTLFVCALNPDCRAAMKTNAPELFQLVSKEINLEKFDKNQRDLIEKLNAPPPPPPVKIQALPSSSSSSSVAKSVSLPVHAEVAPEAVKSVSPSNSVSRSSRKLKNSGPQSSPLNKKR